MSELSDISTENEATTRSPTDNTMMVGMTEKPATSSSFSKRVKNTLGNFFPFTMGTGKGDEADTQAEEEDDVGQDEFGSQVSLNSSTQENGAYTDRETGTMDQFGVVRTISKTIKESGQSRDFVNMTKSEMRIGQSRNSGLSNAPADSEVDSEKTSRQRIKARISTSTKLPGIVRVTPPLVTPLVENGASIEEALTNIVGSIGEQIEQMSIRMSELERAVHVEKESLREEINCNRQEASRSKKRWLDGLLGSRIGSKNGESNSGEPSREPRVNFNEQQNRRTTYGPTRGRGSSSGYTTGDIRPRGPNIRGSSIGKIQTSNERPTQDTHATGRCDSRKRSHASQGRNNPSESDRRENREPL